MKEFVKKQSVDPFLSRLKSKLCIKLSDRIMRLIRILRMRWNSINKKLQLWQTRTF